MEIALCKIDCADFAGEIKNIFEQILMDFRKSCKCADIKGVKQFSVK